MAGLPIPALVSFLLSIIKGVFQEEARGGSGDEKEERVLIQAAPALEGVKSPMNLFQWFLIGTKIIKAVIRILNDALGKNWLPDDQKNIPKD